MVDQPRRVWRDDRQTRNLRVSQVCVGMVPPNFMADGDIDRNTSTYGPRP